MSFNTASGTGHPLDLRIDVPDRQTPNALRQRCASPSLESPESAGSSAEQAPADVLKADERRGTPSVRVASGDADEDGALFTACERALVEMPLEDDTATQRPHR